MMSPHMEALGFTLVHFCWQAAAIAAAYKIADTCLPRLRAQGRYVLSLSAMLAMLASAVVTFIYEELRLAQHVDVPVSGDLAAAVLPEITRDLHLQALLPWLDAFWLAGVVVLSARMLGGLWFIHNLKKKAQAVPSHIAFRFSAALRRFGLSHRVTVRLHPGITGPFVIGVFRSVVYLPFSAVTALSPEQLDAVLSHELEHIRRADFVWNLVQSLVETLFFYHPAVWWIGSKMREQRELCCDDAAIQTCDDPITYATALLNLEEQRRRPVIVTPRLSMALNGEGKNLLARISRVLGEQPEARLKARPVAFVLLPVMLLTLTAFAAPVQEVASKICPKAAEQADAAMAHLEDIINGNEDRQNAAEDLQIVREDLATAEADRHQALAEMEADDIDPEAIAAEARAAAIEAQEGIRHAREAHIDSEQIAREARQTAREAKAEMERAGMDSRSIDVEAIAARAMAEAERAKADVASTAAMNIDVEAIAEQARQGALRAKAQRAAHRAQYSAQYNTNYNANYNANNNSNYGAYGKVKTPKPPKAPVAPEAYVDEYPAPLAEPETPPTPPAAPALSAPVAPIAPVAPAAPILSMQSSHTIILAPVKTQVRATVFAPVQMKANAAPIVTLNRLPKAKATPIPSPDVKTDVHVRVNTDTHIAVMVATQ